MGLKLIYGRAGTGKTSFCFQEISKTIQHHERIYIITPEQFSFSAEQNLMKETNRNAIINAEVLTFERMAFRVISEVCGNSKNNLTETGKAILLYDILDKQKENLIFLGKTLKNVEVISKMISEFKKHNIAEEQIENIEDVLENQYLKSKLQDITILYKEFNQKISESFLDENDLLTILYDSLDQTSMFDHSIIYIDEFAGFTKQELLVIEKLLLKAKQVTVTICADDLNSNTNPDMDIFYPNKITANKLVKLAEKIGVNIDETIRLSNAYRFKNDELKFLEENIDSVFPKINTNIPENIKLFLAMNPYSEVEYIAKNIIELVRDHQYRYRDIAIITNNMEEYSHLIKVIFTQYDIPVFIDENKDLNQNPFIKYIVSLLDVFSKRWSMESVFHYAKTGFLDLADEDIFKFQSYCSKWGIKGYQKYANDFNTGEIEQTEMQYMNTIRKKIVNPLISLKQNIEKEKTVSNITKKLYEFLIQNNIDKVLENKANQLENAGNIELANTYRTSWNILMDVLDEMILTLDNEKVSFEKYTELLKTGLSSSSLGKIPATLDEVIVGNVDRSRSSKKKIVFIIGLNDGKFPSVNKNEGFIDDAEREELKTQGIELAKTVKEQIYDEKFNIYKAFTTAEEKIYLTYSSSDINGKGIRKSNLIGQINKLFVKLKEDSDIIESKLYISNKKIIFDEMLFNLRKLFDGEKINPIWVEIYNIYLRDKTYKQKLEIALKGLLFNNIADNIDEKLLEELYGDVLKTSISRLETYRRCPFSFYIKYILKLSDKTEYKIETLDTGNFMHEVIDEFFEKVNEQNLKIRLLEDEEIKAILNFIIEDKLKTSKNYLFVSSPKYIVLTNRLKKVLLHSIKYIINTIKNSDFNILGNEIEFAKGKHYEPIQMNLEDGKKIEITGKIDRVDIAENEDGKYIRIIDYKSSIKNIDLNQVMAGIQIQLLTYLDAITNMENVNPAGILYFNLIEPVIKSKNKHITNEELEKEIKDNFKMNGIILGDVKVVQMMDNTLKTGKSDIIPAYIDKDGNLSKSKSNSLEKNEFQILQKQIQHILKQISKEILEGNIKQNPIYLSKTKKTTCEYCKYKPICQFNQNIGGNHYHYIPNLNKNEILYHLKEKNK